MVSCILDETWVLLTLNQKKMKLESEISFLLFINLRILYFAQFKCWISISQSQRLSRDLLFLVLNAKKKNRFYCDLVFTVDQQCTFLKQIVRALVYITTMLCRGINLYYLLLFSSSSCLCPPSPHFHSLPHLWSPTPSLNFSSPFLSCPFPLLLPHAQSIQTGIHFTASSDLYCLGKWVWLTACCSFFCLISTHCTQHWSRLKPLGKHTSTEMDLRHAVGFPLQHNGLMGFICGF